MKQFTGIELYPKELKGRFNSFIVTEFDDSMTVEMQFRVLIKWIQKNIELTNEMVEYLNEFISKFDANLYQTVLDILTEWYNDGIFKDLVNETIAQDIWNLQKSLTNKTGIVVKRFSRSDPIDKESTDYYVTYIPMENKGTKNVLRTGMSYDDHNKRTIKTTRDFAYQENTHLAINGAVATNKDSSSLWVPNSCLIVDGELINSDDMYEGSGTLRDFLTIDKNGKLGYIPINNHPLGQDLIDKGIVQCFVGFWCVYADNKIIRHDDIPDWKTQWETKYQRQLIGQTVNGDIYILTTDGKKTTYNKNWGMTVSECTNILVNDYLCEFVYMMDGGGSTQLVEHQVTINQVTDDYFSVERKLPHHLYISNKEIEDSDHLKEYKRQVGFEVAASHKTYMRLLHHNSKEVKEMYLSNPENWSTGGYGVFFDRNLPSEIRTKLIFGKENSAFLVSKRIADDENGNIQFEDYVLYDIAKNQPENTIKLRGVEANIPRHISKEIKTEELDVRSHRGEYVYTSVASDGLETGMNYYIVVKRGEWGNKANRTIQIAYPFGTVAPVMMRSGTSGGNNFTPWRKFIV